MDRYPHGYCKQTRIYIIITDWNNKVTRSDQSGFSRGRAIYPGTAAAESADGSAGLRCVGPGVSLVICPTGTSTKLQKSA